MTAQRNVSSVCRPASGSVVSVMMPRLRIVKIQGPAATTAAFLFMVTGGAEVMNLLLKSVFHRSRPALWPSLSFEADFSFPSGHAMFSAAVLGAALVLLVGSRWQRPVLIGGGLFALLVGL